MKAKQYFYIVRRKHNSDVVGGLFFTHPDSLHLLKLFPYVVEIDSTYKTNQYVFMSFPLTVVVVAICSKFHLIFVA